MNSALKSMADARYWEKIERARKMSGEERMVEGVRMFERECEARLVQIGEENPTYSPEECHAELRRRLYVERLINEVSYYQPTPNPPSR